MHVVPLYNDSSRIAVSLSLSLSLTHCSFPLGGFAACQQAAELTDELTECVY